MEGVITIKDKRYPKLLKQIGKDAPKVLYYKGAWDNDIFKNCLSVIGSRRITNYGRIVIKKTVSQISCNEITIVSGFMYGVDAEAHKTALDMGGRTIAVMPCGVNIIHPEYQKKLYEDIINKGGLIISEYENNFPPAIWTYPKRNRIVAGLSKATMIIEGAEKSGSLITTSFAKKYKRKIFAVPGPINSLVSVGTNNLIKNKEAEMVMSSNDILKFYNIKNGDISIKDKTKEKNINTDIEEKIIKRLQNEELDMDTLSRELNISIKEISLTISIMQIKGIIGERDGKFYLK